MDADITLTVNGAPVRFVGDPLTRLLDVLRGQLGLTGAKEGCGEGECGACTVWLDGEPVCACLVPMLQLEGRAVRTVEGLASARLTALQQAFVDEGAVQCGACTPGMVMSAEALLAREPRPSEAAIRTHLAGNVCRCTGYQAIVRAVQRVAAKPAGAKARPRAGSKPTAKAPRANSAPATKGRAAKERAPKGRGARAAAAPVPKPRALTSPAPRPAPSRPVSKSKRPRAAALPPSRRKRRSPR